MKHWLLRGLERQPNGCIVGLSLMLVVLVGMVDYILTPDLSLAFFYLLPISLAAWFINGQMGTVLSLLSILVWMSSDLASKPQIALGFHLWNAVMRLGVFGVVSASLAALKTAHERENHESRTDRLTGVANRRFFLASLTQEEERSRRYGYPLALAYIALDNFKALNERGGHAFGDRVLQQIAHSIQTALRNTDVLARLGGDEFAILMPHSDQNAAKAVMVRIYRDLCALSQQADWRVGFSIGLLSFNCPPEESFEHHTPEQAIQILEQAYQLMKTVKRSGKNRIEYCPFTPEAD
ncbi:MAG: GGDEF domain-containing protein [Cyanobacteria bacterium P01_A01_bin.123]